MRNTIYLCTSNVLLLLQFILQMKMHFFLAKMVNVTIYLLLQ